MPVFAANVTYRGGAILAAAVVLCLLSSCVPDEGGKVVARVDGEAVTLADVLERAKLDRGPSLLVEMIDARLIEAAAAEAGLEIGDEELEMRRQRAVAEAGSEADFEATLARRGVSRPEFLDQLRMDMLLDKLATGEMVIADQEVADFYREHLEEFAYGEQVKARMMLFVTGTDAEAVRETLLAGGDFAGLAGALSTDPGTKDSGGEMGWFERGDYAAAICDVAFALEVGGLSQVFEAPDGWVILEARERRPAGHESLAGVREQLLSRIRRAKLDSSRREWMMAARRSAAITISDDELREQTLELLEHAPVPQRVSLFPIPVGQP
jgi:foldase protein PrsA